MTDADVCASPIRSSESNCFGVLSYVDELGVGITVDPDVVGDPRQIVAHMRASSTELADLVR